MDTINFYMLCSIVVSSFSKCIRHTRRRFKQFSYVCPRRQNIISIISEEKLHSDHVRQKNNSLRKTDPKLTTLTRLNVWLGSIKHWLIWRVKQVSSSNISHSSSVTLSRSTWGDQWLNWWWFKDTQWKLNRNMIWTYSFRRILIILKLDLRIELHSYLK